MAYGHGSKDMAKRMADLGQTPLPAALRELRAECIATIGIMARAGFTALATDEVPTGKDLDRIMLRLQSEASKRGLNNVWAEKCRLIAKAAIGEQMRRRRKTLFGRFKHIAKAGDRPMPCGTLRLVNLPQEWSHRLTAEDVAALEALAARLEFGPAMALLGELRGSDAGLPALQAEALRAMTAQVEERFGCPEWTGDAVIQLHLDYRCLKGGKAALAATLNGLTAALKAGTGGSAAIAISAPAPRGPAVPVRLHLPEAVAARFGDRDDQSVKAIALELGPDIVAARAVITRPVLATDAVGSFRVLAEDFGFAKTSSMVVVESDRPISEEALTFLAGKPGKTAVKAHLASHVSGDDVRVLERLQFSGAGFLARIREMADKVDGLRAEIDLNYNRLERIRRELNAIAGHEPRAIVPHEPEDIGASEAERGRYGRMHGRFFRILGGIGKLKARRRGIYRSLAGLKIAWFGHIANAKARLAEAYGAVVAREDLTILAVPKDDPAYKGRTFNRMINNGAKGQYIRRADNKLQWKGLPGIVIPSYYTSTTDWRTGTVDKRQRRGAIFTAASDGARWDADLHAAEMIGRWLFLRPKETAALAAE